MDTFNPGDINPVVATKRALKEMLVPAAELPFLIAAQVASP